MGSLKDALLKAGLKPSTTPKDINKRENIPKKKAPESVSHQVQRNYCEECQNIHPDVEFYQHRNPTTEAEWICVRCADRLKIADTCRRTAQSDTSIKNMFKREHGMTLSKNEILNNKNKSTPPPRSGNR